ncbi:Rap guanine nucleotide exchange factor 1 [Bagarius yarrelli]|uniref:Rap guanine nucleotide exchange factor 1 n=1 Tax=Bagarius yarrelli TaxID=175774 RepID=A0A556UFM0_BAGYA|nr:Rap guanine nucleotide exchange factor 1 [Bagarius yarrelli]
MLMGGGVFGHIPCKDWIFDLEGKRQAHDTPGAFCLVELTEDILKHLMDLVVSLVCSGELSLARVLRKNILDKVKQKKLLTYTNSFKPLAARSVAARPGTLHDFRSHEIADQLTLLDAELFYKIEIPEVLLWAKEQNEEKSPNLTQFTEHFNNSLIGMIHFPPPFPPPLFNIP